MVQNLIYLCLFNVMTADSINHFFWQWTVGGHLRGTASSFGTCGKWPTSQCKHDECLWRGRGPRTTFPKELMLLLSIALLIDLMVITSLIIYGLCENSKGGFQPLTGQCHWYIQ